MEWSRVGMKAALLTGCSIAALSAGEASATVLINCDGNGLVSGTSCSLAQLVLNNNKGSSIKVEDKLFDNWSFISEGTGTAENAFASGVKVTGLDTGDPGPGLRFDMEGFFVSAVGSVGPTVSGTQLSEFSYDVTAIDPGLFIHDNLLMLNSFLLTSFSGSDSDSSASLNIEEDHAALNGKPKIVSATKINNEGVISDPTKSRPFDPVKTLNVITTITLSATANVDEFSGASASAQVSSFEERFSQIRVPEPATLGLLGIGLGGLSLLRRRQRKSAA